MKRLLALVLLALSLTFTGAGLAFADEKSSTSSFNVFEILSVDPGAEDAEGETTSNSENLTQQLRDEAEERTANGVETSPAAALILRAINILILLVGTFAFVMIVIGGFMVITAGGVESNIDKGKSIITQAVAGLVIAFMSYLIVSFVLSFFY